MTKLLKLAVLTSMLALVGCSTTTPTSTAAAAPRADTTPDAPVVQAAAPVPKVVPRAPEKPKALPAQELTRPILFRMLLAEIALQRGQTNVAASAYLELARETRDPRIAQRATEVAWTSRFLDMAMETSGIWIAADPESQQARQFLATLLVSQSRLEEAAPYIEKSLAADRDNLAANFMQLNNLFARHPDKTAILKLIQTLAQPYQTLPEARFSTAQAAWNASQRELALEETRAALKLRPDWDQAALSLGQILQRDSMGEALAYFQGYLKQHPRAVNVRLHYARLLVGEKKFPEARAEFQTLLKEFPDNAEVSMAVGLLALQTNDHDAAEKQFEHAIKSGYKDPDAVRYYLGQLNESRKRPQEALRWYSAVEGGEQYVPARGRYAAILAAQGKVAEARKYLQESPRNAQQGVVFTQAEAQLLRDAGDLQGAFDVLGRGIEKTPGTIELLYDQAMVAEKLDKLDVLESNLRRVIKIKPDHAHAYNALGYTFADRNIRLTEAQALIEQGLKIAPDDPFILDSMGWVLYRMGQIDAALVHLKRAFDLRPDAEIAAHLGEVLWAAGQRDEARKIWAGALKESPANEVLLATVKKFSN